MAPPQLKRVTPGELRRMFNRGRYAERADEGEFTIQTWRDGHPSPPRSGEPFCTRSQILAFKDALGKRVAIVHRYLRPDGTLGASGKPDPKELVVGGVLYTCQ